MWETLYASWCVFECQLGHAMHIHTHSHTHTDTHTHTRTRTQTHTQVEKLLDRINYDKMLQTESKSLCLPINCDLFAYCGFVPKAKTEPWLIGDNAYGMEYVLLIQLCSKPQKTWWLIIAERSDSGGGGVWTSQRMIERMIYCLNGAIHAPV